MWCGDFKSLARMLQEWSLLVLSGHFVDQKITTALASRKPGNHSYEHGQRAKKIHKDKTMTCPQIPRKAHSAFCIQKCLKNNKQFGDSSKHLVPNSS